MRKFRFLLTVLCCSIMLSSCVGSFSLFNRLVSWNQGVGNKFVNELVFIVLNVIPVYGVCTFADAVVLNSIEFWTGSNPLAHVGDVKQVKGENGNYMVETQEDGYTITKEGENASMQLKYNSEDNTWNVVADGVSEKLVKMNDDDTATLFLPDGRTTTVTLDDNGMLAARQIVGSAVMYAAR